MDLAPFREHLPEIERRFEELQPDALVFGLGPSAHLFKEIAQKVPEEVRLWGVNDIFNILPVHDVVCMDPPKGPLDPSGNRGQAILKCKPDRLWLYNKLCADRWLKLIPEDLRQKTTVYDLKLCPPHKGFQSRMPDLEAQPVTHTVSSPCGTTCMAWQAGARRIGVIGVDLLPSHKRMWQLMPPVVWFFSHISHQAWQRGGRIANLSPFSRAKFHKYNPWKDTSYEFGLHWTRALPVPDNLKHLVPCPKSFTSGSEATGSSTGPAQSVRSKEAC